MCDAALLRDMHVICSEQRWPNRLTCHIVADMYYWVVRVLGNLYYNVPSPNWCHDSCVPRTGEPGSQQLGQEPGDRVDAG